VKSDRFEHLTSSSTTLMTYTTGLSLLAALLMLCSCSNSPEADIRTATKQEDADLLPGAPPPNGSISWSLTPRNSYVLPGGSNETYLYLSVKSGADEQSGSRKPLNISLVLDRSGSMSGDKIRYAKDAAKFVIDRMSGQDQLSIINYDDRIEISSPQQEVRNKAALKKKIDELSPRGGTNLTDGMLGGYAQVQTAKKEGYVNRVLLLTDGQANEGITSPEEIKKIVRKKYNDLGITLSTFGLGAGYNEDLLTAMAETGGANYYFIESANAIAGIFERELKGLLSVLGQEAVVTIDLPAGTMCEKVYGYPYDVTDGKITIRLNDIYASDEKGIVIRLRSNNLSEGLAVKGELTYSAGGSRVRDPKSLRLAVAPDRHRWDESLDHGVAEKVVLFEANEEFDAIMAEVDRGNYTGARRLADSTVTMLRKKQAARPSAVLKEREAQISKYAEDMSKVETMSAETRSIYQKSNKSMNYESKKMRR
jgi:Ca-activated chloride channel family protein